ncbi:zinc chelation protein SecC [Kangiella sp. HD9-110m-PIT-SAG07]|nr:zinc chelation protein SecC [Kangiella sp. HD9-110m-PIT-SAG07]
MKNIDCPCDNKVKNTPLKYEECCQQLHLGKEVALHPEQLMRSRYSAYFFALGQYIHDTQHQDFRGNTTPEEFTQSAKATRWCRLEVISSSQQSASGLVEFKASFIDKDKLHTLHEVSNFIFENGYWLYTDGQFQPKTSQKINRNQPCPCGSGLKAKRCCL